MAFAYAEAAANLLTNPALDPFGKIPEFKYCAVAGIAHGAGIMHGQLPPSLRVGGYTITRLRPCCLAW